MNSTDPRHPAHKLALLVSAARAASPRGPSTGNDIVALSATDRERTTRPRFYSRILNAGELALYDQQALAGLPFDNYVWLLWSIKESVYKYKQRTDPGLVFSPTRIPVRQVRPPFGDPGSSSGDPGSPSDKGFYTATIDDTLYSRSIVRDDIITTVVSGDENFANTRWGFEPIGSSGHAHQSAAVRASLVRELNAALPRENLALPREHLQIAKNPDGCPVILDGEEQLTIPVSLAHHDRWIAWSFLLPAPQHII
jgi:4'-phosphopantetheinyl transferase superfamily